MFFKLAQYVIVWVVFLNGFFWSVASLAAAIYKTPTPNFKPRVEIAALYIEHEGRILLVHRQEKTSQGNKWGIPAGKVKKGETPLQAVTREVFEETGYDFSKEKIEFIESLYIEHNEKDHFIYHMFRTPLIYDPANVKIDFREHKGFTWITPQDSLKMNLIDDEDACFKLVYDLN
jgi:phosphoglycolate phosphatase